MKTLMFMFVILSGCDQYAANAKANQEQATQIAYGEAKKLIAQDIQYVLDPRTELCFATYSPGYRVGLLTEVPCSDKVKGLIK